MSWLSSPWLFGLFAVAAGSLSLWLLHRGLLADRSRGRPRCPKCWYSMEAATSLVCPECGHDARERGRLFKTRRRWGAVALAAAVTAATLYGREIHHRHFAKNETWRWACVPSTALVVRVSPSDREALDVVMRRAWDKEQRLWSWQTWLLGKAAVRALPLATPIMRMPIAQALACAAQDVDAAAADLLPLIDHEDPNLRNYVRNQLAWLRPERVAAFDDGQLRRVIDALLNEHQGLDTYLLEFLRRGDPRAVVYLSELMTRRNDPRRWPKETPGEVALHRIGVFTALRRAQARPDPLRIAVDGPNPIACAAEKLPILSVGVMNVDPEAVIQYEYGGDNRGPRQEKWRFDVLDARGRSCAKLKPTQNFGGLGSWKVLKHGDRWDTSLDMNAYIDPLPPGQYTVIVQHHPQQHISEAADVGRFIVIESDPIKLIVREK
jgi:hypothetical protein